MRKLLLSLVLAIVSIAPVSGQVMNTFEYPQLPDSNMDYTMIIDTGDYAFHPGYDDGYNETRMYGRKEVDSSYTGFTISNFRDSTTPGKINDRAAYPAIGAAGSNQYGVGHGRDNTMTVDLYRGVKPTESAYVYFLHVTNATITALSMMQGDSTAKKFGGDNGTDPDWLLLTINGHFLSWDRDSVLQTYSKEVYLADFRSADSSEDYILTDWLKVELEGFGEIDSLSFHLSSSDTDSSGMKTPAYFCIDDIGIQGTPGIKGNQHNALEASIYPNPAADVLNVKSGIPVGASIYDLNGKMLLSEKKAQSINLSGLSPGIYLIRLFDEKSDRSSSFLFQKIE